MRLWHQDLIHKLPRQQLLGQHRECCALRGNGWRRPHSTINYIFEYPFEYLVMYHFIVMHAMEARGYTVSEVWKNPDYSGKNRPARNTNIAMFEDYLRKSLQHTKPLTIYAEHNAEYLTECIENLKSKGVELDAETST